ncbi:MAG: sensor histidine kinase [Terrisporobacter sp.]|uniref:sensor histidine kinase n=1 Tax=Terrisporobacter sp. TaxID=1965305 RepID=UPI002FC79D6D
MIDKYIYSHNDDLKYFDEQELKVRGKLINPILMEKATWYLLLLTYCIAVRRNPNLGNVSLLEFMTGSLSRSGGYYLLILLYSIIAFTGISLIVKSIQIYALIANSDSELEFISKKRIFKKWCTYILNTIFSICLIKYMSGGIIWRNLLISIILIKIAIKLLGLLLSKIRRSMLSSILNDGIEEFENGDVDKIEDVIGELIGDGKDIEIIWGLGFKQILMETKKLLSKIEEVTVEEKELHQNKNYLITNLSHDLKTPLTSIINSVYILKNEELNENEIKEQIKILENKLDRLNNLIKNLNETVDGEYKGMTVNKEEISLNNIIKDEFYLYEDKFKKSKLNIKINLLKEDVILNLDKEKIIRIVDNILSNIEKYSLEDTRVYVDMINNDESVEVIFKNISKYYIDPEVTRIGERFVQGDKSRNTEGHGLGLSIIKSLVKIQGGSVNIDIQGDLFKLTLKFNK